MGRVAKGEGGLGTSQGIDVLDGVQAFAIGFADCARSLRSLAAWTVAEGAYSRGKNRQARFQTAAASAREVLACWETAQALGWCSPMEPELSALFNRVIGTLVRLTKSRF